MAYTDPQTITVSAVAHVMARIASGDGYGVFQQDDASYRFEVRHTAGKRQRHSIKITQTKTAPDPLISAQNIVYSQSVILTFDQPRTGFTIAEGTALWTGISTWLSASSAAVVTKLLGGEN